MTDATLAQAGSPAAAEDARPRRGARPISWYPVVLALAWLGLVFLLYRVSPYAMWRSFLVVLIASVVTTVTAAVLFRDGRRGAAATTLILVAIVLGNDPAVLLLCGLALLALVVERLASRAQPRSDRIWDTVDRIGRILAFVAAVAVVIAAFQWDLAPRIARDIVVEFPFRPSGGTVRAAPIASDGEKPDIYLLMLDGYARADTLATEFGFDDSAFLDGLADRGLVVSPHSRATYLLTAMSLSSLFNMSSLDDVPAVRDARAAGGREDQAYRLAINTGTGLDVLRDHGYTIVANGPGYEQVSLREADRFVDSGVLTDAEVLLLGYQTIGGMVVDRLDPNLLGEVVHARLDSALSFAVSEAERADTDGPKLVFAHVPGPHPPLAVDSEGRTTPLPITSLTTEGLPYRHLELAGAKARYVEEARYLGIRTLETIDRILAASPEPPIIIVFSDHGTDVHLDWSALDPALAGERVRNLFAASTPRHPGLFGDAPTLVNTLPVLFDAYLGTSIPRATDESFVWDGKFGSPSMVWQGGP